MITRTQMLEAQRHVRHAALYVIFSQPVSAPSEQAFNYLMGAQYAIAEEGELISIHSGACCNRYRELGRAA